jgi:4-diphosphocytidyl-2-C-methyl-D-erythritol kinase
VSGIAGRLTAQAKVNLALRVLARETSGYHQIETLFARLELGDELTVRVTSGARSLDCAGPALPAEGLGPVERNLAWRAAERFAAAAGWPAGFAIEIDKRIPVGGGLGGGSADAGAVLRILAALAPRSPGRGGLLELAAGLGADVPFLTSEAPLALGWGRGERMLALPALPARDVAIVVPPFGVPTAEAYRWVADSRGEERVAAVLLAADALHSWAAVTDLSANDFEEPVGARHPEIPAMIAALARRGARIARLSGSGSTVFGVFDAPPDAATLAAATGRPTLLTRTAVRVVEVQRTE